MLLSIDRVLQLLSEGKSLEKIAELSESGVEDVANLIIEARNIIMNFDKTKARKKVVFKKKDLNGSAGTESVGAGVTDEEKNAIFSGSELSAVPYASYLLIFCDGASSGNPGPASIGLSIHDKEDREVGRVSDYIGENTNNFAEYSAIIRALQIAIFFKTKELKIRSDSELVVKQIKGEYKISSDNIRPLYEEVMKLKKKINNFRIEHISRNLNDKADYLAKKAIKDK